MSAGGRKDYKTLAEFANAATVGLAAVILGSRTPAQFREWLRWVTVQSCGLEPETHKLLDMMADAASGKKSEVSGQKSATAEEQGLTSGLEATA